MYQPANIAQVTETDMRDLVHTEHALLHAASPSSVQFVVLNYKTRLHPIKQTIDRHKGQWVQKYRSALKMCFEHTHHFSILRHDHDYSLHTLMPLDVCTSK